MLPLVCHSDVAELSLCLHTVTVHALQNVSCLSVFSTPEAQLIIPLIFMSVKLLDILYVPSNPRNDQGGREFSVNK